MLTGSIANHTGSQEWSCKQRQPETVTIKIYLIEKKYSKADLDVL